MLEAIQADVAQAPVSPADRQLTDPLDQIAAGVLRYLLATSEANTRRILLIDGPTVVGWQKWREIDARIFGAGAKAAIALALGPNVKTPQIDAIVHLLMGSVTEAALVCAGSPRPKAQARVFAAEIRAMLEGIRAAHGAVIPADSPTENRAASPTTAVSRTASTTPSTPAAHARQDRGCRRCAPLRWVGRSFQRR